jgi:catechol 2,3-dioxygenase-like lactoylglutathione lyase family enzyme
MPKLDGILETALYTDDMERARTFYEGVLELQPIFSDSRLCAYGCGGPRRAADLQARRGERNRDRYRAAPFPAMTARGRCMSPSPSARTNWRNGNSIWLRAAWRSKARPPGRAAAAAFIFAIRMGTCWNWQRPDCGPCISSTTAVPGAYEVSFTTCGLNGLVP